MSIRTFLCKNIQRFQFYLYDAVPPCVTQLPSEISFITTIYAYLLKEVVYCRGNSIV